MDGRTDTKIRTVMSSEIRKSCKVISNYKADKYITNSMACIFRQ